MKQIEKNYWLTPPEIYAKLNREFVFDFDPCPHPRPKRYNGLITDWGKSNYVNPPYRKDDCFGSRGMTAWIYKAIEENKKGKRVVLLLPVRSHTNLLLEAGAEIRSAGRTAFLDTKTKERSQHPVPTALFILK